MKKECTICKRKWEPVCEQTQCIEKFGRCLVCVASENPIEGLEFDVVKKHLHKHNSELSVNQK